MFEWDQRKSRRNLFKHGLSFHDAELVFEGPCVTLEDGRFGYGERRYITLGHLQGHVVLVAHTQRGGYTRIISMRKANSRERRFYEEQLEASRWIER